MPLPSLLTGSGGLQNLKSLLGGKSSSANEQAPTPVASSPKPTATPIPRNNQPLSPTRQLERVKSSGNRGDDYSAANDNANQKAIERSRGSVNPMIPLVTQISNTLIGMDKTLKDILGAVQNLKGKLEDSVSGSDLGFDTDSLRERGRERSRRGRPGRAGRTPRSFKSRLGRGVVGGLIGAGLGWGASKILGVDDDTAEALEVGGGVIGAGAGYLPKGGTAPTVPPSGAGAAGAAESGGWFGKLGKFFKTGGKVIGKAAAPLTVATTVAENWDELKNTGSVDPINQGKKALGGLGKVFDLNAPFFSLDRLEGAGDALSGATGAVYGAGTEVGKVINNAIPPDFSDKVIDGIVGLFGGETNEDRAKKQKEIEDQQKKAWEERRKKREEEQKKKEEDDKKVAADEEKKKKEEWDVLMQGQKTASAIDTAGAISDTPGVNVGNLSDVGKLEGSPIPIQDSANLSAASEKTSTVVSINQPADKPVPVVLTDEKGAPLINSADRKEGATLASKVLGTTQAQPSGATPQVAPNAQPSTGTPWLSQPKEMSTSNKALAAAASPIVSALHQSEAGSYQPQWSSGQSGRIGVSAPRQNAGFGESSIGSAQAQAANQDLSAQAGMPTSPSLPVSTNPAVPQQGAPSAGGSSTTSSPPSGKAFLGWAKESVKNEFMKRGYSPEQADIFARGAAAQLVQETGWNAGSKQVGQNNFFNIKESKNVKGDVEGKRAFDKAEGSNDVYAGWSTPEKGIAGYVDFLTKNPRYAKAGVFNAKSSEEYAQALQKAGFATDPNYAKNITSIMNGKKLGESISAYNQQSGTTPTTSTSKPSDTQNAPVQPQITATTNFSADALKFKNKQEAMGGGNNEQGLLALANNIQSNVGGMKYITAMNDQYHQSDAYKAKKIAAGGTGHSDHQEGTAMDFTLNDPKQSSEVKKQVEGMLKAAGVEGKVIDEYKTKTSAGTGGHIHVNFKNKEEASKYAAFVSGQKPKAETPNQSKLKAATPTQGLTPEQASNTNGSSGNTPDAGTVDTTQQGQPSTTTPSQVSQVPAATIQPSNDTFLSKAGNALADFSNPAMATAGAGMTKLLHQDEAYTHNLPGHQWSSSQGSGGRSGSQRSTTRTNTQFGVGKSSPEIGQLSRNPIAENTVTGMTPPAAAISTMAPSDIAALGPRMAQNYNLLGIPNVQASLDALQAGGAQILSNTPSVIPGIVGTGLSAVDSLRQSGALNSMMSGDVQGLIGRVAPELSSSINGMQSVFNQSLSGGGGFAHQFNQATGNVLKGSGIPRAIGGMLGGGNTVASTPSGGFAHQFNAATGDALKGTGIPKVIGGLLGENSMNTTPGGGFAHQFNAMTDDALKGTGIPRAIGGMLGPVGNLVGNALGAASNLFSTPSQPTLNPQPIPAMGPALESAGFNDKTSDVIAAGNATAQGAMMAQVPGKRAEPSRGASERGSSLMDGQSTDIQVRNPESSIRRLTDMMIAYTFRLK